MIALRSLRHLPFGAAAMLGGLLALAANPASATEGGTSLYLLGSGGPEAAILPPVEGVYFDNTYYFYGGDLSADQNLVVGGNVAAGLDVFLAAQFVTFLWVPSTDFLGGTVAVGGIVPFGAPIVSASAIVRGPRGGQRQLSLHDGTLTVGDPVITAELGWKWDRLHLTASGIVNIPVGDYHEGELANVAFHRWAEDLSLAASWHDPKSGWDISAKTGATINGGNDFTQYDSGNELHVEAAVEKTFSPKFSAGIQGYYNEQISGDSGAGAVLGPNEGHVAALGGTLAYNTVLGRSPATIRVRLFQEFAAKRRTEGTAGMLSLTIPLKMNLPAQGAE
ncbi:transporter [Novosphingobium sp. G106]|uniref:SphA family protein n=1 Tax=Novosphingobium sp. G106 TaxID=2849500 RepID=UPI001C2DE58F|nr:transporter [Novosphingobium sp. G106]MBV1691550.1 transporter [Novosphingobium sp. G106]